MDANYIQTLFSRTLPEKIAIVLDVSTELADRDCINETSTFHHKSRFEHIKRALEIFIKTKQQMSEEHEFALITLDDQAHLLTAFTRNVDELLELLSQLNPYHSSPACNINTIFSEIEDELHLSEIQDMKYNLRIILIYGRNTSLPEVKEYSELLAHPHVYYDLVYVHAKDPTETIKEIYRKLGSLSQDIKKTSYIFEMANAVDRLYRAFSLLTAHAQQRLSQEHHDTCIKTALGQNAKKRK